ncbi:hypothetical protein FRC02_006115 [Tulasnella sp. 418]|nr:hypothetical protein FRC02_006115 [Tulasnella sp. 418]
MQTNFWILVFLCGSVVASVLQLPLESHRDSTDISIRRIPLTTTGLSYEFMYLNLKDGFKGTGGDYDRDKFGDFTKRGDVLKRDAIQIVKITDHCGWTWYVGTWYSPWDNQTLELVHDCAVEIDHVVPLKEAWITGASSKNWGKWTNGETLRSQFLNDEENLVTVSATANSSKGAKAFPQYWPRPEGLCKFIRIWIKIKYKYQLTTTREEREELKKALTNCAQRGEITLPELESYTEPSHTETIDSHPAAQMSQLPVNNHSDGGDVGIRRLPRSDTGTITDFEKLEDLKSWSANGCACQNGYARENFGNNSGRMRKIREDLLKKHALLDDNGVKQFEKREISLLKYEIYGSWTSPWDGQTFKKAHSCIMEIDHILSLKEAWTCGACNWSQDEREDFAIDIANLVPVYMKANRGKSAAGFPTWEPWVDRERCNFAKKWLAIKHKWELSVTQAEFNALELAWYLCPRIQQTTVVPKPQPCW